MKRVMVRYKLKADRIEENEQLVRNVYEGLRGFGGHINEDRQALWAGVTDTVLSPSRGQGNVSRTQLFGFLTNSDLPTAL